MLEEQDANKNIAVKPLESSAKTKQQTVDPARKREIELNNFKLSKFKDVPSKIKPLIEASKADNKNIK